MTELPIHDRAAIAAKQCVDHILQTDSIRRKSMLIRGDGIVLKVSVERVADVKPVGLIEESR